MIENRSDPIFRPGDVLRRRRDPSAVGVLRDAVWSDQLAAWLYRVRFGQFLRALPAEELEALPAEADIWQDLLDDRLSSAQAFQRLMVSERLRKPPTRIAAAFGSAKAKFLAYQFKPLLKFLESPTQRLLIADDVGLGKTLEAGYVLRELRARQDVERVLVVVPARLKEKWKQELDRRFDESFETVRGRDLEDRLLRPLTAGRELPTFSWIVSFESVRSTGVIKGLEDLQPAIDLLVVDEAHRARNPDTLQHQCIRALAGCADAALLLTATPIQTHVENLFHLLRLLEPETFERFDTFMALLEGNRPVVRALAALREQPPALESAGAHLRSLAEHPLTGALTRGDFFESLMGRLSWPALERSELVALQRDISELSLMSHVLSRTRKVEVLTERPIRHAQSVAVALSPAESAYYTAVVDMCQSASGLTWGESMGAIMAYRCAASCIPASRDYFRDRLGEDVVRDLGALEIEGDEDNGWYEAVRGEVPGTGPQPEPRLNDLLRRVVTSAPASFSVDSKFNEFKAVLEQVWREDAAARRPQRKVLVFAYFKRTLKYLAQRLRALGVDHEIIHGDLAIPEREDAIERFLNTPGTAVLLSSEVGSEGLDLQEASVVVNYDLPWNPMVVEQRIGRIDRIGQRSPTLTIVNLVLRDTIEERILLRLFDRIGLFRETIGELDQVLGEQVFELASAALRGDLTAEEQEYRTDQAARAFLGQQMEAQRLQRDADLLIAGDQAFLDEVESLIGERRVPSGRELHHFLRSFLSERYPGSTIAEACLDDLGDVVLQPQVVSDLLNLLDVDADVRRVVGRSREGRFTATFEPDVFLRHPRTELLTARHPLIRVACEVTARHGESISRAFRMCVGRAGPWRPGYYLVLVWHFDMKGVRPRVELRPVCWSFGDRELLGEDSSRRLLVAMLDGGTDDEAAIDFGPEDLEEARSRLLGEVDRLRAHYRDTELNLGNARAARRRATQESTLISRLSAAERRQAALRDRGHAETFPGRMASAAVEKERRKLEAFRAETSEARAFSMEDDDVALVLVRVVSSDEERTGR